MTTYPSELKQMFAEIEAGRARKQQPQPRRYVRDCEQVYHSIRGLEDCQASDHGRG